MKNIIFFILVFVVSLDKAVAEQSNSKNLFKIVRTNYKEDHILHYDVKFAKDESCNILNQSPIDGYYTKNGSRIEFNDKNKEYYEPRIFRETRTSTSLEYDFPVLTGLDSLGENKKIFVNVNKSGDTCKSRASLIYQGEDYIIKNITIKLKIIFGFPTGTEWARLDAVNKNGKKGSICLLGECE